MRRTVCLNWSRRATIRTLAAASIAVFAGFSALSTASAEDLAGIKSRGYMTVATEDDFRPFEFVDDGKPTGYDNELLELLRKKAPVEIRQDIIPWSGILPGVVTGKYDMAVTAVMINADREKTLDFTSPIAEITDYYVKRKADDTIKSLADLNGKTIGVQVGSAMLANLPQLDEKLKSMGGTGIGKIVEYQSYPEAYQDLAIGRVDVVDNTVLNLRTLVAEKPDVFELGEPIAKPNYVAWATKKGNKALIEMVNAALIDARKSGEMYKLQEKWFGMTFKELPETWPNKD